MFSSSSSSLITSSSFKGGGIYDDIGLVSRGSTLISKNRSKSDNGVEGLSSVSESSGVAGVGGIGREGGGGLGKAKNLAFVLGLAIACSTILNGLFCSLFT